MSELAKKIEALLFVGGEGMTIPRLASILKKTDDEIITALGDLEKHLAEEHFLALLRDGDHVSLVTAGEISKVVEDFAKEEFAGELTRSGLDTLAIIAYKGPIKRSEIDYVRGVNSSFMIRNLLMRGLIERTRDPKDARAYFYKASTDFLKFLGINSISELPDFGAFAEKLDSFLNEASDAEAK